MPVDNREELKRLQTRLTDAPDDEPSRSALQSRTSDLLRLHGAGWAGPKAKAGWKRISDDVDGTQFIQQFGPVFGLEDQWQFQNGGLEICTTSATDFLLHGHTIREQSNLQRLALHGIGGRGLVEMRKARIEKYRRLNAPDVIMQNELKALAEAEQRCPAESLIDCGSLRGIRHFRFERLGLVAEELDTLLGARFLQGVESLYLYQFSNVHYPAFRKIGHLPCLRELDFEFWSDSCGDRGIEVGDEEGAEILATSPALENLNTLRLRYHEVGDNGLLALVGSRHLRELQSLDLRGNYSSITDDGLVKLAAEPQAARLRSLNLSQCNFSNIGALALARSPQLVNLVELQLAPMDYSYESWKQISGEDFAVEISNAACLPALRKLNVSHQMIGDAGIAALANSPRFAMFTDLGLAHQGVTDDGLIAFAQTQYPPRLHSLDLSWNPFGDAGFTVLCQSPVARYIEKLSVGGGTPATGTLLAESKFESLVELRIHHIDESILEPLAASASLGYLRRVIYQSGVAPGDLLQRDVHAPVYLLADRG